MLIDRLLRCVALVPLCALTLSSASVLAAMPLEQALQEKPVISNLLPNDARLNEFGDALGLTRDERDNLDNLILSEKETIAGLIQASNVLVRDDRLSLEQKRAAIEAMDYNGQIARLAQRSSHELQNLLGPGQWEAFLQWGQRAWEEDAQKFGPVSSEEKAGVLTVQYKVYATQYDAYTTLEVAVPDKYVKFAAQGSSYATGYPPDLNYSVTLDRSSYHYTVRVYEVGPWNIDDNYWNSATDPNRPRRLYKDLPQGMPESQAAYTTGYNGGKDQYGRTVANQAGVDLSIQVAANIGLAYLQNDWVTVTYLWETGSSTGGDTANLVGYVRENDIYSGKGIAGATVKLNTGKSATADANGYYKFTGIAAGSYTVTATAKCYKSASTSKTVTAGIDNWASIAMTADGSCGVGTISGYVKDGTNQNPVANASLTLSGGASATTTTNSSGYYTFNSVVPGTYTVSVTANCYFSTSTSVTSTADQITYKDITMNPTTCGGSGDSSSSCGARVVIPGEGSGPGRSSAGALAGFVMALGMIATHRRRR